MVEKEYAKALYDLALEEKKKQVFDECFLAVLEGFKNEDFIKVMSSPAVSKEEKKKIIKNVFGSLDETFINFLYVLVDHNRFTIVEKIYDCYYDMLLDSKNVKTVEVISAKELTKAQLKKIEESIASKFENKKIEITNTVEPNLIGGIQILADGESIDVSLKSTLLRLKDSL